MKTKKTFVEKLNILDGVITWNSFDIDENLPFEDQEFSLTEDMLQIAFGDKFILDVGWQPDLDPKGFFIVYVIRGKDWENPISKKKCKTMVDLKKEIESSALLIDKLRKRKDIPQKDVKYEDWD